MASPQTSVEEIQSPPVHTTTFAAASSTGDGDGGIKLELIPLIRVYKDGHYERLSGTDVTPAGYDPASGVKSKDAPIQAFPPVSARVYLPPTRKQEEKLPVLVYFHGGGFIIESTASPRYHAYMNSLASRAGLLVVSVEYRRVPEDLLPAAFEDAMVGLKWVISRADPWVAERGDLGRLFLGGDSAGATIAQQTVARCHEEGLRVDFEGMLLTCPYFWGSAPVGLETTDPVERFSYEAIWQYSCPEKGLDDPWINPLVEGVEKLAETMGRCRRVLVNVGAVDLLAERGKAYYEALKDSRWGGEVELVVSDGQGHVFSLIDPGCVEAQNLMEKVVEFFNKESEKPCCRFRWPFFGCVWSWC